MTFSRTFHDFAGWTAMVAFASTSLLPFAPTATGAPLVAQPPAPPAAAVAPWTPPAPVFSREPRVVSVPRVMAPSFKSRMAAVPEVSELREFRGLRRPLMAAPGRTAAAADRVRAARMLEKYVGKAYERPTARLDVLLEHLRAEPDSPFAFSLWLEASAVAKNSGDFELALEAASKAWEKAKKIAAPREALEQAEQALANLASLYAQLGQREALSRLMTEIENRVPHTASNAQLAQARAILENWKSDPDTAAICGIMAYNALAAQSGAPMLHKPTQEWAPLAPEEREKELQELSAHGMSASQLVTRVRAAGSDWRWIRRISGVIVPSPSVIHLQFGGETGHYSALLKGDADFTRVVDHYLRLDGLLENTILNRQASGYFMVPGGQPLPEGFAVASTDELDTVFGRTSCPNANDDEGDSCESSKECCGMAVASVSRFLPGLIVRDQPLTYRPLYGPGVNFLLEYRQVQLHGEDVSSETSHLGPLWNHSFISYVKATDSTALPGSAPVRVYKSGTYFEYTRSGGQYVPRYAERPALSEITVEQGGPGYRLTSADGSYQDFTQPNGPAPTRYYLTKITDAQGHTLSLGYDNMRLVTITDATDTDATEKVTTLTYDGLDRKIQSITDPFGRTAEFAYDPQGRLQSITDPINIVSSFSYDDIDDDDGLNPERITSLTTPYGTTHVKYEGDTPMLPSYLASWSVTLTDPEGFASRVEYFYHDGHTPFTEGPNAEPRPPASIMVGSTAVPFLTTVPQDDHFHVTLEWDKKQWYHYKADKAHDPTVDPKNYAQYTLWLMRPSDLYSTRIPAATRKPGQAAVWYNYEGQAFGFATGSSALPIKTVRQVEDENGAVTWVMTQQAYNALGQPTVSTDERGRQTRVNYLGNNQDPSTEETLTAPSTWTTLRTYGYPTPNLHLPSTVTDVSGVVTTTSYNEMSQVTEVQTSKGASVETTRRTYSTTGTGAPPAWPGTPGFLMKVEHTDPANAAAWVTTGEFTYDALGRMRTHTDASGYQRTFDYDDFDRPTLVTHPDGSTEQSAYNRLDLAATKDRAGRWSRTLFNPRRQPVARIAPDGDVTQYEWCLCGQLQKLIDPLGRMTKWTWTIGGRNTEKTLPDGVTKTTYTYQPRSGRLATMTQPNDQGGGNPTITYRYQVDGRLQQEDYTDASTPDVTYTYEPGSLGRLTSVVDGIGTHALNYVPLVAGTAGAGRVEYVDGPLTNDRIQNVYDWQNRVGTNNLVEDATTTNLRTETTTWDTLGRPETVVNTLGTHTFGYTTNLPRPDTLSGPNTVTSSFTYTANNAPGDSAQKLASITHTRGATQQAKHVYGYDKAGRITGWEQHSISQPSVKAGYSYNLGDELVQAEDTELAGNTLLDRETWGLDSAGNWLSHSRSATNLMETRTIDVLNRLNQTGGAGSTVVEGHVNEFATVTVNGQPATLRADPAAGGYRFRRPVPVAEGSNTVAIVATDTDTPPQVTPQTWQFNVPAVNRMFTYDDNGNTLTDGQRTMTWDAKNRLKTVTKDGTTWKWDYDHQDRRVREYTNDVVTKVFIWSGTEIVQERNATNVITHTHYRGGFSDGPAPTTGAKYQTLTDHLGNVREVLTAAGAVAARYDYTPYQGPVKIGTSMVDATLLTIGRYYHHAGCGLELALYRAYDADLGRWLSRDPIEEKGGLNLFEFVANNPVNASDPLGLNPFVLGGLLSADTGIKECKVMDTLPLYGWHRFLELPSGKTCGGAGGTVMTPDPWAPGARQKGTEIKCSPLKLNACLYDIGKFVKCVEEKCASTTRVGGGTCIETRNALIEECKRISKKR